MKPSILCHLFCAATAWYATQAADSPPPNAPLFPLRAFYAPGHFGNSYEVMGELEMRATLTEAAAWGFNRYVDWFDCIDCADPFADPHYNLAGALWDRKKAHFRSAQTLGLACDLCITPNHVYLDQCQRPLLAQKDSRTFGQLICPSKPEARQIILNNYEKLFADLAKSGVQLNALWFAPYDYGGCACDQCKPWILTFAKLSKEIQLIAKRYHPAVELRFIGWWWSAEEHRVLAAWADREIPGQVKSIALYIPYDKADVPDVILPQGCERQAFVHTSYAEGASPKDSYGHLGPVIAAERIQKTVFALQQHGCTGVMTYSEGVFDDVNRALLGGLSNGHYKDADSVLAAYAQRYFAVSPEQARRWVDWVKPLGRPFDIDTAKSAQQFKELGLDWGRADWRLRHWESKSQLLALHQTIMAGKGWTPDRLQAVNAFWAIQEQMQRHLWGLGPLRHILARRFTPLPWYADWAKHMTESRPLQKITDQQ